MVFLFETVSTVSLLISGSVIKPAEKLKNNDKFIESVVKEKE